MSEREINQYRLTDTEEPTDEMLAYIMHEVAEEARRTNEEAMDRYFNEINDIPTRITSFGWGVICGSPYNVKCKV